MKNLHTKRQQQNGSKRLIKLSIMTMVGMLSTPAIASDAIGPGDSDSKWVLGLAVGAFNNPYSGEGTETWAGPTIRYNGERFFLKDGSLNLHLAESNGFSAGLTVALDYNFLSDDDDFKGNEKLVGLSERDATLLGGFYVNHDADLGRLSFSALTDLGDEHDGSAAELKYTFDFKVGKWNVNPELGAQWVSDDYVDHFAGVSASEATDFRSQYQGQDTINAYAGIRARYEFTDNLDFNVQTGVTKLGSGIENSSIIDDDLVYHATFGINYNY